MLNFLLHSFLPLAPLHAPPTWGLRMKGLPRAVSAKGAIHLSELELISQYK
jgi:hypothetical protein